MPPLIKPLRMTRIALAQTDTEIENCFPVMVELRPHIGAGEFLERVRAQQAAGYELLYLETEGEVQAVAGFRLSQNLAWGRFLYVDDLVSKEAARSRGYGQQLFNWLVAYAREQGCQELHLDSGVQRFRAHQFYLAQRMIISSHHFSMAL